MRSLLAKSVALHAPVFSRRGMLAGAAALPFGANAAAQNIAPTPPMGWNSWDSFATTINEEQARANAAVMAERLLPHGYRVFTVDIQWYEPGATGYEYRVGAPLEMDEWGRLLPAPNRFPSAANGQGFKPLADDVHALGLQFGVHLMRGIPRLAVDRNLPVKNTDVRAADIADRSSICPWNPDMYGVDMSKPGAQAYYDSVFQLFAAWGVDFVKVDDIARPYFPQQPEIEAIRRAIDGCGRAMTLSLSPGETPLAAADHVRRHANMWRISDDFWDEWSHLTPQFARLKNWNPYRGEGAWPDADMLPFGALDMGRRTSRFTQDEQITCMTLWCIARSPLIMGGDLRVLDDFTHALLTNDDVLAVNQQSRNNRPLFERDGWIAWTADAPEGRDKYLAVFNTSDRPEGMGEDSEIVVDTRDIALGRGVRTRDLWSGESLGSSRRFVAVRARWHGARLLRISPA
jgi:alpha-galactosidase